MPTHARGRSGRRPEELAVARSVALRVVAARGRAGWTQHQLAFAMTKTDVPMARGAIAALEAGASPHAPARAVTVDELVALARALNTTPYALLHGAACQACEDAPPKGFICNVCRAGDRPYTPVTREACRPASPAPARRLAARMDTR